MLTLNVGLSKKIGLPDYGSKGASVNLELELASDTVCDSDRLKERIRQMFVLARAAVDEELAGTGAVAPMATNGATANGTNGTHERRRDNTRRATASQVRALNAIADRRQLDLAGLLADRFGTREASQISIVDASQLIDELKGAGNGAGGRR